MKINKSIIFSISLIFLALFIILSTLSRNNTLHSLGVPSFETIRDKLVSLKFNINKNENNQPLTEASSQETVTSVETNNGNNTDNSLSPNEHSDKKIHVLASGEDLKYQGHVLYSIIKNWQNVDKNVNEDFSMIISIDKNGRITSYDILKSSKDKTFQKQAIDTVLISVPFQPFESKESEFVSYMLMFRGNSVRIGHYELSSELPYKVNYKKVYNSPYSFEETKLLSTVGSAPVKFADKLQDNMPILRNWVPPLDSPSEVNVGFDLSPNGEVVNAHVINSKGSEKAAEAALNALKNAKFNSPDEYISDIKYWFKVNNNQ